MRSRGRLWKGDVSRRIKQMGAVRFQSSEKNFGARGGYKFVVTLHVYVLWELNSKTRV